MINVITFFPTPGKYIDRIAVFLLSCREKVKGHLLLKDCDELPPELNDYYKNANVKIYKVPSFRKLKQKKLLKKKIEEIINTEQSDKFIIHDHFYWLTPFKDKMIKSNAKIVVFQSIYAYQVEYFIQLLTGKHSIPRFFEIKMRLLTIPFEIFSLRKADLIITQTKELQKYLFYVKNKKKEVISNSIKSATLQKERLFSKDKIKILAINRWYKTKGANLFIKIITKLYSINSRNWELSVGGPNAKKVVNILQNKIDLKINNLGEFIKRENLGKTFKDHDIFVYPSPFEGSPRIVLEAASYGLPVVTFDLPGLSGIINPECAINTKINDTDDFAYSINSLLNNSILIKKKGYTCIKLINENFSNVKVGEKLHYLYLNKFNTINKESKN